MPAELASSPGVPSEASEVTKLADEIWAVAKDLGPGDPARRLKEINQDLYKLRAALASQPPEDQHPGASVEEGERFTIWVCPECGVQLYSADATCAGGVFSDRPMHEIRMAEPVEVVPASQPDPDLRERLEELIERVRGEMKFFGHNRLNCEDICADLEALLTTSGTSEEKCECGGTGVRSHPTEPWHKEPCDCSGTSGPTQETEPDQEER